MCYFNDQDVYKFKVKYIRYHVDYQMYEVSHLSVLESGHHLNVDLVCTNS